MNIYLVGDSSEHALKPMQTVLQDIHGHNVVICDRFPMEDWAQAAIVVSPLTWEKGAVVGYLARAGTPILFYLPLAQERAKVPALTELRGRSFESWSDMVMELSLLQNKLHDPRVWYTPPIEMDLSYIYPMNYPPDQRFICQQCGMKYPYWDVRLHMQNNAMGHQSCWWPDGYHPAAFCSMICENDYRAQRASALPLITAEMPTK